MKRLYDRIQQTLSLKLSLRLLSVTMVICLVSIGFFFFHSRGILQREVSHRAFLSLENTASHVNSLLGEVETATLNTEWLVNAYMQPDSLLAFTRRITELNPNIHSCFVTTEPYYFQQFGRYYSACSMRMGDSVVTVRETDYDYYGKAWYKIAKQRSEPCWIDPYDASDQGTLSAPYMICSFSVPLYDARRRFVGVLASDISLKKISDEIASQKSYAGSYYMMLGHDGRYFVHPDTSKLVSKTIFTDADPNRQTDQIALGHEMIAGKRGSMQVVIDGKVCQVFYMTLKHTPWSLALVCPESELLSSYNKLFYLILFISSAGLLLLLLLCHRTVAYFVAPLNHLAQQARSIAEGQFDGQVPHTSRFDSIGRLQNNFADMQLSIASHVRAIQETNEQTKLSNENLLKANQMVEESQRKKKAFVQNMTHQIRTPLNIVLGFAQVMRDNHHAIPQEELQDMCDMMEHNTVVINRMALMLLDSSPQSRAENLSLDEVVSCNAIARETIFNCQRQYPLVNFQFETTLSDDFTVSTNRLYLFRCLRELLYNAAKYSDGQSVWLRASMAGRYVRYVVEDTGPGISEAHRDTMFDRFAKVDDFSEGLGLGLPLTYQHARNLGGSLTLDAAYDRGCRFILDIPKSNNNHPTS